MKSIGVVGDGVMSWVLVDALRRRGLEDITVFSADSAFPPCSLNSTAINCLRGTKKGLSELGDDIVDAYKYFKSFIDSEKPFGVYRGVEYQFFNNEEKWARRYSDYKKVEKSDFPYIKNYHYVKENEAYFIDTKNLKKWFHSKNQVKRLKELVQSITNEGQVKTLENEYQFDHIFVLGNYATSNIAHGFNEQFDYYLDHCKPVAGTYLEIGLSNCDLSFKNSFNYAFDSHHFIYRKEEGVLQIGSTTDNRTDSHLPNKKEILPIYNHIKLHLDLDIPELKQFNYRTGVRHKGYKRKAFYGKISEHISVCCGLYKNGYVLPFLYADKMIDELCNN